SWPVPACPGPRRHRPAPAPDSRYLNGRSNAAVSRGFRASPKTRLLTKARHVSPFQADLARTSYVDSPSGRFGYRRLGTAGGVPLVLVTRFRGTIDHWDPVLLDVLARERDVILADYPGVNTSAGPTPATVCGLAGGVAEFI